MTTPFKDELIVIEAACAALRAGDPEAAIALLDKEIGAIELGRTTSTVLHTRVPNATARKFTALAESAGLAPGVLARVILTSAVKLTGPTLAKVAKVLDLDKDATLEDVIAALREMFPAGPPAPSGDPLSGTPAAPPAKLTAKEEDFCRKHSLSPAQFAARKATAVRTTPKRSR